MRYHAYFKCFNEECARTYPLDRVIYHCESCGSLLDVVHDIGTLRHRSAQAWMKIWDERFLRTTYPYGSTVWARKEMVLPEVDDRNVVSFFESGGNCFYAERLGKELGLSDLWIKLCGGNHSASFKDLGMTVLVSWVKELRSRSHQIPAVACASTGDTSASLAAYAAAAGIPCIVFLPKGKVSTAQLIQPLANDAITLAIDTNFDGCMKLVQQICEASNIYLANSMNPLRIEGQKTLSFELVQEFSWEVPDWIIVPSGNMGNVTAIGKGFLMMYDLQIIDRLPRLVVAQAERANPLYRMYEAPGRFKPFVPIQPGETAATAIRIGDPVNVHKAVKVLEQFDAIVEQTSEDEMANAAARADRTGLFTCPQTGVALAVLEKLVQRGVIKPEERTIVVSTAHGLKFVDWKVAYHNKHLDGVTAKFANAAKVLPAEYTAVKDAVWRELEERKWSG